LADCGLRVTLEELPRWELLGPGPEGPLFGRQFDAAVGTWWLDEAPPCERYLSSQVPGIETWDGANVTGYQNTVYDDACLSARRALPGTPAFERYHREAQVIFSHHLPSLPLFVRLRLALTRPGVENFHMDATAGSELWNLEMLDVRRETLLP
jgi:ABC-type oligopeptide transport system substrate-binding subunit